MLHQHNILFIADEVQTGFARTGKLFAIETYNVVPDILTMAKALGNGMPISAFSTTDEIANAFTKPSASTLGGNPVASKTALAVIDYIDDNNLCQHSEELGGQLASGLSTLVNHYNCLLEVRGKGLMLGVEVLDTPSQSKANLVDDILEMMKDKGVIIGKNGLERNVLAFQPPLVITQEDVCLLLETLADTLNTLLVTA